MTRELEELLKNCHMALIGLYPASYTWTDVNDYLARHGKTKYSKKLKRIQKPRK